MKILKKNKLENFSLNTAPYQYGKISDVFGDSDFLNLCQDYPTGQYTHCETLNQDKTYSMLMRKLYSQRENIALPEEMLSEVWLTLINDLLSDEYRLLMSGLVSRNLKKCSVEINCWQYPRGGWLSPHTDKPNKVISQLFYFNEIWDGTWGGSFNVLKSRQAEDVYEEIFPEKNMSIVLVRSNHSWHSVSQLQCPEGINRKLLQVIFWE